jgi:uncharacterized membrane protein YkoI
MAHPSFRTLTLVLLLMGIPALIVQSLASAQEKKLDPKELPAPVLSAFKAAYPAAKITGASSEKENGKTTYEIESTDGKTKRDLAYTADGKVMEIEETIEMAAVPAEVKGALDKACPKGKVEKAEKVTEGKVVKYEFQVTEGKKKIEVAFDPAGKILKPRAENEKGEKEGEEKDDDDKD